MAPSVVEQVTVNSAKPTTQPLKIEMVLAQLGVGGMEIMVTHLMRALRGRGHQVGGTCIVSKGTLFEQLDSEGFRMRVVSTRGWHKFVFPQALIRSFRSEAPDIVHIHSGAWIKAAIAAKRADMANIVFTHHGLETPDSFVDRTFNRYAASQTDRIVAVSEDLKQQMRREGGVPRSRHIHVLPNGVPTNIFSPQHPPAEIRNQFGIANDGVIIGCVARMFPVKNHTGLIEAFARIAKQHSDAYLVLVGDGPTRPGIENEIARRQLTDRVFLTGEINNLAGVYRAFDIFALASHSEGTSISILEALASGTSVVATAVGGNPNLLGEGKFGTLVPPNDPDAFAKALDHMLKDDVARNRLCAAGREHVIKGFSVDVMCDAYEALYYDKTPTHSEPTVSDRSTRECVG